jgi:hydroxymethylglutaryl-CoA lyase
MTRVHLCDVFVRRNTNRSQADEIATWAGVVERARAAGATEAAISVNAAWGSNWAGPFEAEERMAMLRRQHALWTDAGIAVTKVWLGDPMGWNTPLAVEAQVRQVAQEWREVRTIHLHLHDQRGLALTSAWSAARALEPRHTLVLDASVGGIGGCPYCGNGRATGMIPTEDLVHLLEASGVDTGVDLDALLDVADRLAEVLGRRLDGHVSRAGPFPGPGRFYPLDLPLVETFEEARHFRTARGAASRKASTR